MKELDIKLTKVLAMLAQQPVYTYSPADPKHPSAFASPPEASQTPLASGSGSGTLAGYAVSHFDLMNELKERFKLKEV